MCLFELRFSLGICPEVGLLDQWKINIHVIWLCFVRFSPRGLYNFAVQPTMHYSTCFPTVLSKETMDFAYVMGAKWFLSELKFVSLLM